MSGYDFPIDFPQCPSCGCKETLTRLAYEEIQSEKPKPQRGFASLRKTAIPLENPQVAVLKVSILLIHEDICARCGLPYCTRAEIQEAPIQMIQRPGQGGQFPFGPLGNLPQGFFPKG